MMGKGLSLKVITGGKSDPSSGDSPSKRISKREDGRGV